MFTGIIEEVGEVTEIAAGAEFSTLRVRARRVMEDLAIGSSVCVNGVCLTVRSMAAGNFSADLSRETIDRTSLQLLRKGSIVNLERPMRGDSRFGGHMVQGHVDGVGRIRGFERQADSWDLEVEYPPTGANYLVEKGSVAVDGISLTVASLRDPNVFSVAIIPHTFENTNLQTAKANDPVNLEFDVLAKYVEKMIGVYAIRKY
jgi:riboflavin synthase